MRHFLSTPSCHPSARPNACQKCGSSHGACTPATPVESCSFRVHAENARGAPSSSVSRLSEPLLWYPPSAAFVSASAMVICVLLCAFGGTAAPSRIFNRSLTVTALVQERLKVHRPRPPLLNHRPCRQ